MFYNSNFPKTVKEPMINHYATIAGKQVLELSLSWAKESKETQIIKVCISLIWPTYFSMVTMSYNTVPIIIIPWESLPQLSCEMCHQQ